MGISEGGYGDLAWPWVKTTGKNLPFSTVCDEKPVGSPKTLTKSGAQLLSAWASSPKTLTVDPEGEQSYFADSSVIGTLTVL